MSAKSANQIIFETFRGVAPALQGSKWDHLWEEAVTPWDRGGPSPALRDVLSERTDLVPSVAGGSRKKALVPGCGRGHDALLLASFGYDVVGLDLSKSATVAARMNEKKMVGSELYETPEGVKRGQVTWIAGDFFGQEFLGEAGVEKFDLIYDYTFSCALPMALRPKWAARTSELLSPEGRLVILQFPNGKSLELPGPPWGVNSDLYLALLSRPGEEISCDAIGKVPDVASIERSDTGLQRVASFTPRRTHPQGVADDGNVTDVVSVWAH